MNRLASMVCLLALSCGSEAEVSQTSAPARKLVTADWMNRSLSVFDLDAVIAGDAEAPLYAIDLAAYSPGPVELEVAPDGRTALVAVGPAFLDQVGPLMGLPEVPAGGALLVVDLDSRKVRGEIAVSSPPMGLAIAPDGKRGFAALYGERPTRGRELAVVDLESVALIEEVDVGPCPEQLALDAAGAFGIVSIAGEGTVRTFDVATPSTLSPALPVSSDSSGVAFVEGTSKVVVANSLGPAGYSVVDVSVPLAPAVLETVTLTGGSPFGATAIPGSPHVLFTQSLAAPVKVTRVDAGSEPSAVVASIDLENASTDFALGVAVAPGGKHAFVGLPADKSLSVVDLDAGSVRALRWLEQPGPTWAAIAVAP